MSKSPNPAEQADLDGLQEAIRAKKIQTFEYMASMLRYTEKDMLHSGYGKFTKAEAMKNVLERANAEIERLIKSHIKRWPDDGL